MTKSTPKESLRLLARASIISAKGDADGASEFLNAAIIKENSATLERELCKDWRNISIRALLATHFNELRAEGKIATAKSETKIRTTNYDRTTDRPKTWASEHVKKVQERKHSYLDHYFIDGISLGDCKREQVLDRADKYEEESYFLRSIASPLPPNSMVRDFISEDEAGKLWKQSKEPNRKMFEPPADPVWQMVWPWLMKGIKKEEDYKKALGMTNEVMDAKPGTPQGVLLDALANCVKQYEDENSHMLYADTHAS